MDVLDSLSRLLEYSWVNEEADYKEMLEMGEIERDDPNHIFTHIKFLRDWMESDSPLVGALRREF